MFSLFKKRQIHSDNPAHIKAYQDYLRLVKYGEAQDFLDVDTPNLIEIREAIDNYLKEGQYDEQQVVSIKEADNEFRHKAHISAEHYRKLISNGDERAEFLKSVLIGISYPDLKNKGKWWYHLLDS